MGHPGYMTNIKNYFHNITCLFIFAIDITQPCAMILVWKQTKGVNNEDFILVRKMQE